MKYRGNVGTIVRSAVQSNSFEKIYLVEKDKTASGDEGSQWEVSKSSVSEEEINYYSLQNAPLIDIQRVSSVPEFVLEAKENYAQRHMVAVELHPRAKSLYTREAIHELRDPALVLVVGAEDGGIPNILLDMCQTIVEIPSLSASINVSCAFMAVLSVMNVAQIDQIAEESNLPACNETDVKAEAVSQRSS